MKPVRAVIVDDEPLGRARLRRMLAERSEVRIVGEARNGREAVSILRDEAVDLVFLDVQMPEIDGFGVIEQIGAEHMPAVIFTTAYDEYALRAFDVHALDYLLKPFDEPRFTEALDRALRMLRRDDVAALRERLEDMIDKESPERYLKRILIKTRARVYFVRTEDIDWIEAARNYVCLRTGDRSHLLRQTLTSLEEQLDPDRFMRVHRSAIVNLDSIEEMHPLFNGEYEIRLQTGDVLTLTRTYKDKLESFLPGG